MSDNLRTQSGPWCGGLTDTSVMIRASILRSVTTARVIVAENEQLSTNATAHDAVSLWADPDRSYRHQVVTFTPGGLRPDTNYFFRLELDGDVTRALPGRFRTAPRSGQPLGFRFALGGCAKPKLFGGTRPEAYKAIAGMSDLLFFFHLGDFHYENVGDESVVPRLEAYDDTLRREGVGDLFRQLPLAYCWDDHDFLGNNTEGGDPDNATARRFARDAYDIYVPHYPLASSTEGIYQSFRIGRVLFLLTDSRFAKSPRRGSGTSGKTVLGVNQKTWLKSELLRGKDLDLIVWASSIPWIGADDPGEDYWAGYATERAELCQHLVNTRHPQRVHDKRRRAHGGDRRWQSRRIRDEWARWLPCVSGRCARESRVGEGWTVLDGQRKRTAWTGHRGQPPVRRVRGRLRWRLRPSSQVDRLSRGEGHQHRHTAAPARVPGSPDLRRLLTVASIVARAQSLSPRRDR